jgi:predicted acyltransferase
MWNFRWLLHMSRWSRRPPGARRVAVVVAVIALCLAIAGVQWAGLWPDALTLDRPVRPHFR